MLRFVSRREWLRLGLLGFSPAVSRSMARVPAHRSSNPGAGKAKSVLVVFASGGQSQIDTWDPKPDAPAEVRGLFRPIATSVPGVRFCEHMPNLARRAKDLTVVRSMSHDDLDHGSACYLALTGHFHPRKSSNPLPRPTDYPTMGAILRRIRAASGKERHPYPAVHLNGPLLVPEVLSAGQDGGFLGRAWEPLNLSDVREGATELRWLEPRGDLPAVRLDRRRSLLESIEQTKRNLAGDPAGMDMDVRRRQAYELLDAPATRDAFDLSREPRRIREGYGLHRAGAACLLARRLVEAGVPWINVFFNTSVRGQDKDTTDTDVYGWDTHNDIFEALRDHLLPRFDQTFSFLLEDLRQRGLLDQTLVVCMGEFGRAPLVALEKTFVGATPGRKHWAGVYSIAFAGAGVGRGKVLGPSDRLGAYPTTPAYSPGDVSATLFNALGIDPEGHYRDGLDRPIRIAEGTPIRGLYEG